MVSRRAVGALLGGLWLAGCLIGVATAADTDLSKTAGGVTVYLGIVPAEIVKGLPSGSTTERPMHGRPPKGPHEYHVVAAVFDAASGARISDAVVTAEVSGLGLSGAKKKLEPMQISGTTTYGGFFDLPGFDLYTVKLTVERTGASPAALQFKYDHRR
ncbi:hypothetical protein ACFPFP_02235 [Bradyrhizobium sp. GCM10023182]|uniref:DUF4426 domain-containing protein n=1 Tax=Bradyrhizobium zhengyangense TaxID=2911009 RepID=A0ABS9LFG4_9BRAD|nr:hypothetical protein [Bradyrhizobium zhengyangense]MCG2665747.1 hypothetical protein [Bradyrhizobium zhengyangense]